jgi:importin-4
MQPICVLLTPLLQISDDKKFSVRGRALECLGHIAVAVGAEAFRPYFEFGMQSAMNGIQLEDETLKEFSYVFFANCVKVMKTEGFEAFAPQLVPHLLEVISESEYTLIGPDDDDDDDDDAAAGAGQSTEATGDELEDVDAELNIEEGFINTKKAAITALGAVAENLGAAFYPYLEKVIPTMFDTTNEDSVIKSNHALIRGEAASTLTLFIGSAADAAQVPEPVTGQTVDAVPSFAALLSTSLSILIEMIETDREKQPVADAIEAITGIIGRTGMLSLTVATADGKVMAEKLMTAAHVLLQEKAPCQMKLDSEDDDEDDHDNVVMDAVTDLIGAFAKAIGPPFAQYFDAFVPPLMKFTDPLRPHSDRSMAIGCFAEVIMELGPDSAKYVDAIVPVIQAGLADSMEGVRRNSAFCVGALVESLGAALTAAHIVQFAQWLQPLCVRDEAKKAADMGGADIDNAISAIVRMVRKVPGVLPLEQVLLIILQALPLRSDPVEGPNVYGLLIELVNAGDAAAMGVFPLILGALAHTVLPDSKQTDDTKRIAVEAIKRYSTSEVFAAALAQIPDAQTVDLLKQILAQP